MTSSTASSAWRVVDGGMAPTGDLVLRYAVALNGPPALYSGVKPGDWVLASAPTGTFSRVGRIYRIRSDREGTTLYFDRFDDRKAGTALGASGSETLSPGTLTRMAWDDFTAALTALTGGGIADVRPIEDHAYVRELLQLAVIDDVHGPAGGPHEEIVDMGVRDRYLVGKLAPRQLAERVARGDARVLEGGSGGEDVEETPHTLVVRQGRQDPGTEFDATTGRVDAEADAADELDATANQSLVPSSLGMTFCVDGDVERIDVEAWWGRYEKVRDHEYTKTIARKIRDEAGKLVRTEPAEVKLKVWRRIPCGKKHSLDLQTGAVSFVPDAANPEVRVQGIVREKNQQGDRLITLFLVNGQNDPEENKDAAWLFQPELIVRAVDAAVGAIFRRKVAVHAQDDDHERRSLEMIYRKKVEFAVGHGIAVHARTAEDEPEKATEVRTVVMPHYEVPVTETPGLRLEDRPAMRAMVADGYLDMRVLADLKRTELVAALSALAADYAAWISEQEGRVGHDVVGYDDEASAALGRCKTIEARLREGIAVLGNDRAPAALAAFRFANRAMADQRLHSLYALSRRRGENGPLVDFDVRKNRSWRPFQLAFILLAIPALADPLHPQRTEPLQAIADLLWFPTGGGKTEAYLGVAAFAMAIRRLQGDLGGYDSGRGLTVVMRYTLRLLTLQQFQRSSTLICAMELLRQEALAASDASWGTVPFTIGLWVGNKVTPGTTADSHRAIQDIRNPEKYDAGGTSPAQLTSCPWCGTGISANRDVEVRTVAGRTAIYCGDPHGQCAFSKAKSSESPHPGLPVLVVDEELYRRPPSMMIATVDKFALMAWRGEVRTLFGRASIECPRHGLTWPGAECKGVHRAYQDLPSTTPRTVANIRPPDLVIQDEFHLISGPLGTMVGLYETAIDDLCSWRLDGKTVHPKIVASTATVRKADEQVAHVFMRPVAVFPPHGLDVADNFFSVQRAIATIPGRRYFGVCSPGSSRPAVLIRMYTAFLTASQALFDRFGQFADPYMTTVGYFSSLRELGGMRRLAEDDVQTRSYRVEMVDDSDVRRPGLAQRSVTKIRELTSRVSSRDIPKYLDELEVKFKATFDPSTDKFVTTWDDKEDHAIDVVLATNMLSVGVDVNRLGLMIVNGQPKGTAEYIQATSRIGRSFPGLVCTVLTWARPRDLSHYETFEHYHATFYKHVEAQSVTPFSPRAMDRGLTGALLSVLRLDNPLFNPNTGAGALDKPDRPEATAARDLIVDRAWNVSHETALKDRAKAEIKKRLDLWSKEAGKGGRTLAYEKKGPASATTVALLKHPGIKAWDEFTIPMSMREVEPGVRLVMSTLRFQGSEPDWTAPTAAADDGDA